MPHFARIFFIAFASVTAGCSAERAQQDSESMEMGRQLQRTRKSAMRPTRNKLKEELLRR
jgi:hypothetical protein